MKILIIYATSEGQTRKIARFMEDVLQDEGHKVAIADATDDPPSPEDYDAVLIGSPIHLHHYSPSVLKYADLHSETLNKMPSAFFSISMAIASEIKEEHLELEDITGSFLLRVGWRPLMKQQIAGALKFTQYDFFKRLVMRMIAKKEGVSTNIFQDYEYTNWNEVKAFVLKFVAKASES